EGRSLPGVGSENPLWEGCDAITPVNQLKRVRQYTPGAVWSYFRVLMGRLRVCSPTETQDRIRARTFRFTIRAKFAAEAAGATDNRSGTGETCNIMIQPCWLYRYSLVTIYD